jgi:uncharacterized membrane protein HdeD (DUF308 family)
MAQKQNGNAMWTHLIGVILIAVGVVVWWYGDMYTTSTWLDYVYSGIALIVVGVIFWFIVDAMAMKKRK